MHQLAFGGAAHSWIAGLPGDAIQVECEQCGVHPQASTGDGGFTARVAASDDDHVEGFGGGGAETHRIIIGCRCLFGLALRVEAYQGWMIRPQ